MSKFRLHVLLIAGCGASAPSEPASSPVPAPSAAPVEAPPPPPPQPSIPSPPEPPAFHSSRSPIPPAMRDQMRGVTWTEGCPVHIDDLALLELSHWDMQGTVQTGQLVVAAETADAVIKVFGMLFEAQFPIHKMRPAHEYNGDDNASMADNNTSAFNCRKKTGGSSWSEHSFGQAIDINTVQNPYVRGSRVLPPAGRPYVDRSGDVPGLITADGPVVKAFREIGWKWGGNWRSLKDYQHFSASGK